MGPLLNIVGVKVLATWDDAGGVGGSGLFWPVNVFYFKQDRFNQIFHSVGVLFIPAMLYDRYKEGLAPILSQ